MAQRGKDYPLPISAGGALISDPLAVTLEAVGDQNFSSIKNWRRLSPDRLIRREGWVKFRPDPDDPVDQQYIYDGSESLLKLAELVRPNQQRVIVGASATKIKRFNTTTFEWDTIGSGFTNGAFRWQTESINGWLVLNNGVDLPVVFRLEWDAVQPIYGLRENGIASVNRIKEYNGILWVMGIVEIDSNQLNPWMNGYPNYVADSVIAKSANFSITTPEWEAGDEYDVTTGASTITATLPATPTRPTPPADVGGYFAWITKADAGVGKVVVSPSISDQNIELTSQHDAALIWFDGTNFYAKYFPAGVIPATDPYGTVPADILNHIAYRTAWSGIGDPTNWKSAYPVYMPAASATLELPFPSMVLEVGDLVGVQQGGPSGGLLGGQSNYPLGVPIDSISGSAITLAESTDGGISYPRTVTVIRFADIGAISAFQDLQGDGEPIVGGEKLQGKLLIYTTTSVFPVKYVGLATVDASGNIVQQPFSFGNPKRIDGYVPKWGDAIVNVKDSYHLYPGSGNRFIAFDGVTFPVLHKATDDARDVFFSGITDATPIWAQQNSLTEEIWFVQPAQVLAYDYENDQATEIDAALAGATFCWRPNSTDKWFILAVGKNVYTYAFTPNAVTPIVSWLRDGAPSVPYLASGLIAASEQANEKTLLNYTPVLSSSSPDIEMTIQLSTTYNPSGTLTPWFGSGAVLPDPMGNNYIPTDFQAIYFMDEITVTDTRDIDAQISGRILEFALVKAGGVTRRSL